MLYKLCRSIVIERGREHHGKKVGYLMAESHNRLYHYADANPYCRQMVLNSMAAAPSIYVVLYLYLIVLVDAVCASIRSPRELSNIIPECAEPCLQSFLEVNYQGSRCGSSPSLSCLCSSRGTLGFTLGEGAVQCIQAEKRFGTCSPGAARGELGKAFPLNHMYNDRKPDGS